MRGAAVGPIFSPIHFAMHRTLRACTTVAVLFVCVLAGCGGPNQLVLQHDAELDSMYAVQRDLEAQLSALQDTVQFYSDIETGQYYRDRRMLAQQIQKMEYDLSVCRDGGRTIETIAVDALFEPASAVFTDAGRDRIDAIADTLKARHTGHIVRVEGHSDSSPIGPALEDIYPSNWELSAARAAAVVRHLIEAHDFPTGQIEVASYGSTRPLARNDTADGRRENRRIRVAVVTR